MKVYTREWKWYCWHCDWKQQLKRFPAKDTRRCPQCKNTAMVREGG